MEKEFFTVGEVSEIMDMTVKALRFYDRIGLLKPHHVDASNRYRYYHMDQFIYLDVIRMIRNLEISPNDLIPYFQSKDTEGIFHLMNLHKEIIKQKIKKLEKVISGIEQLNKTYQTAKINDTDEVYLRHIPVRHVITTPFVKHESDRDYFLDYYKLNITVNKRRLINTYEVGFYCTKDENDNFHPACLFTTISEATDDSDYLLIPEGNYLCIRYTWDNVEEQQAKLLEHIRQNGLTPLEVVQVELLTDLFTGYHSELFELQIKV